MMLKMARHRFGRVAMHLICIVNAAVHFNYHTVKFSAKGIAREFNAKVA